MSYANWKNGLTANSGFSLILQLFIRAVTSDCRTTGYLPEPFVKHV